MASSPSDSAFDGYVLLSIVPPVSKKEMREEMQPLLRQVPQLQWQVQRDESCDTDSDVEIESEDIPSTARMTLTSYCTQKRERQSKKMTRKSPTWKDVRRLARRKNQKLQERKKQTPQRYGSTVDDSDDYIDEDDSDSYYDRCWEPDTPYHEYDYYYYDNYDGQWWW